MLYSPQPSDADEESRLGPVMADLLGQRFNHLADQWALTLKHTPFTGYTARPSAELRATTQHLLEGLVEALDTGNLGHLRDCLQRITRRLLAMNFSLEEMIRVLLYGKTVITPVLVGEFFGEPSELVLMMRRLDEVLDTAVCDLAAWYHQYVTGRILDSQAEVEDLHRRLQEVTIQDPLTRAFNQRYLLRRLTEEIGRAQRYRHPLSILLLAINGLHSISDTLGQSAREQVLIGFSDIIRDSVRDTDTLARYGDDEFIIMMPETDHPGASAMVTRLQNSVLPSLMRDGSVIPVAVVRISTGIASYPTDVADTNRSSLAAEAIILTAKKRLTEATSTSESDPIS